MANLKLLELWDIKRFEKIGATWMNRRTSVLWPSGQQYLFRNIVIIFMKILKQINMFPDVTLVNDDFH